MTDPGRYDRPDPCEHCGEPHHGDCPDHDQPGWPEDCTCPGTADLMDPWDVDCPTHGDREAITDYCVPGCPDDVCRSTGRCAWPRRARIADLWADVDPAAHGLRLVRDLRTKGEVL